MSKKEQVSKPRAPKYDPKVKFEGTLEQMIQIAIKPKTSTENKPKDK